MLRLIKILFISLLTLLCGNRLYADSQDPAYSLEELPDTYIVSGQEKKLRYLAASSTVLAGSTYTSDSDYGEPQTPSPDFIFYYDLLTKQLSIGPELPSSIAIQKMLITPEKRALIDARILQLDVTKEKIYLAESASILREIPSPISPNYSQRLLGNADTHIYLSVRYYSLDGQQNVANYRLSNSLQFQELNYIPGNQEIEQITLNGLILTSELSETNSYRIFDSQTGQVIKHIRPSYRIESLLNLDTAAIIDSKNDAASTYNLDSSIRGIRIFDSYNGIYAISDKGFVVESDQSGLTFFNATKQINPNCMQPRNSNTRMSFISSSASTGKSLLCTGTSLGSENYLEEKSFLMTPNFDSDPVNYCTRLSVKAIAACKKYFKGNNNYIYHYRGELPKTCKFSVQLLNDSSSNGTAGRLNYVAYYKKSKSTKEMTVKLKKKSTTITIDTQSLSSLQLRARPSNRSGYESNASITFY